MLEDARGGCLALSVERGGGKVVCTAYTFYRSIDVQISNTRLSYVLPKHIILSGEREEGKKEEFELSSMLRREVEILNL